MDVNMGAFGNRLHGFANRTAIFEHWLILGKVAHRDFVAQRDLLAEGDLARRLAFEGNGTDRGAFLQINDGDAYVVIVLMQQNSMFHISSNRE